MSDITKFQNKRLTEIHDELEKDYTPERVMLEWQKGNKSLEVKQAFDIHFSEKRDNVNNPYDLMMNLQTPTWGVYAVSVSESVLLKLPFSFFPLI